jgi:hypothetical protein
MQEGTTRCAKVAFNHFANDIMCELICIIPVLKQQASVAGHVERIGERVLRHVRNGAKELP